LTIPAELKRGSVAESVVEVDTDNRGASVLGLQSLACGGRSPWPLGSPGKMFTNWEFKSYYGFPLNPVPYTGGVR
jgi:hypothetical protein